MHRPLTYPTTRPVTPRRFCRHLPRLDASFICVRPALSSERTSFPPLARRWLLTRAAIPPHRGNRPSTSSSQRCSVGLQPFVQANNARPSSSCKSACLGGWGCVVAQPGSAPSIDRRYLPRTRGACSSRLDVKRRCPRSLLSYSASASSPARAERRLRRDRAFR